MSRLFEAAAYAPAGDIGNYWRETVATPAAAALERDARVDALIIGAGFTGLNAALRLARDHSRAVMVIDAEAPAFGASGRNGGFCCVGGAKADAETLITRHGLEAYRAFFAAQITAVEQVRAFLAEEGVDADAHSDGEMQLAHRSSAIAELRAEQAFLRATLGVEARLLSKADLRAEGLEGAEFEAGLHMPIGFALNPLKYASALLAAARRAGAVVHGATPALRLEGEDGAWRVTTPRAEIRAKTLILAMNGYALESLAPSLADRLLPALSNILLTRPLTEAERAAQNFTSDRMCYDTRMLLHYFRLLPDGRFLFGMRGGLRETTAARRATEARMRKDLARMFPAWAEVETPHFWSGLVCLTRPLTPFIGRLGGADGPFAAFGYHGNGLAFGSFAGRALADLTATGAAPPLICQTPPARFPLPALRRLALGAAYAWYGLRDG